MHRWLVTVDMLHKKTNFGRMGWIIGIRSRFKDHGFELTNQPKTNLSSFCSTFIVSHVSEHSITMFMLSYDLSHVTISRLS